MLQYCVLWITLLLRLKEEGFLYLSFCLLPPNYVCAASNTEAIIFYELVEYISNLALTLDGVLSFLMQRLPENRTGKKRIVSFCG